MQLRLLADETRLAIVRQLMDGPKHVGEINDALGVEQTLLSHHLRTLREAGLVMARRDGKAVLYRLSPKLEVAKDGNALNLGCCRLTFDADV